jgi:TetR/AcrR family transcriptional regulator, mexJK operon transcriptional repressor
MVTVSTGKTLRSGATVKRAAILAAASELFVADGFERVSVDAVAARAGVSKRTVYDYFGDKDSLLVAVFEEIGRSIMGAIEESIAQDLGGAGSADELEDALSAFCRRIARSTIASAEYRAMIRLITMEADRLAPLREHWISSAPEEALAAAFAELGRRGLLEVPRPRLAADHFIALTFSVAFNDVLSASMRSEQEVDEILVDGVRAFLRAYRPARY